MAKRKKEIITFDRFLFILNLIERYLDSIIWLVVFSLLLVIIYIIIG